MELILSHPKSAENRGKPPRAALAISKKKGVEEKAHSSEGTLVLICSKQKLAETLAIPVPLL